MLLSMIDSESAPALYNRRMFVRSLATSGLADAAVSVRYPPIPQLAAFDASATTYLGAVVESDNWWNRLSTMSYSGRPTTPARRDRRLYAVEHGLELSGGRDALGFLFLYELMTALS